MSSFSVSGSKNKSTKKILSKRVVKSNKIESASTYFSFIRIVPNIITLTALCLGMSSIRLAIQGKFSTAVSFIIIACFLDGLDGRLARLLNLSSKFGEQLDSLADFFNFGFAPAFLIYLWRGRFVDIKGLGWAFVLFYTICMALRLARFNVALDDKNENDKPLSKYFFSGIPAPGGAGMIMLPLIMSIQFGDNYFFANPLFVIIFSISIAILMVSTIPTFSLKKIRVKREYLSVVLAVFAMFIIGMILEPWLILSIMGILYGLSIPFSIITFIEIKNKIKNE